MSTRLCGHRPHACPDPSFEDLTIACGLDEVDFVNPEGIFPVSFCWKSLPSEMVSRQDSELQLLIANLKGYLEEANMPGEGRTESVRVAVSAVCEARSTLRFCSVISLSDSSQYKSGFYNSELELM
ncbi:hypothetical protein P7K49_005247, partial [Saguinus oedipus]